MKSVIELIQAAAAAGYIVRNSEEWKTTKFEGGELVVSDTTGARATVSTVREGRPWTLEMECLAEDCTATREIKVQDFHQVTSCSDKCKKALRKAGHTVQVTARPSGKSKSTNPVKVLDEALASGAIDKATYDELKPAAEAQLMARKEQLAAEAKARGEQQKKAALAKKVAEIQASLKAE